MSNVLNTYLLIFVSTYKNTMRKLLFIFCIPALLINCNDGDIITIDLDFDDTFEFCEVNDESVLFYKTRSDPSESLSIKLGTSIEDLIELDDDNQLVSSEESFTINGSTNTFYYRTYSETLPTSYFCEAITPNVNIISNSESASGRVTVTTLLTEDDNDTIPAELEDLNENGDLEDDDSDNDGIPNYLDDDDDGDNVPTRSENPNYSASSGLTEAQDFDLDGTPDYLDTDDDGDDVLTRDEENDTQDQDPTNDITDNTIGPDYLNDQVSTTVTATALREHTIKQTYTITAFVSDFSFPNLNQDALDFGTLTIDSQEPCPCERTITPDIN